MHLAILEILAILAASQKAVGESAAPMRSVEIAFQRGGLSGKFGRFDAAFFCIAGLGCSSRVSMAASTAWMMARFPARCRGQEAY